MGIPGAKAASREHDDVALLREEILALREILVATARLRRSLLAIPISPERLAELSAVATEMIGRQIRLHRLDGSPLNGHTGPLPGHGAIVTSWQERAPVREGDIAVCAAGVSDIGIIVLADLQPDDGDLELALLEETAVAVALESARLEALFATELTGRGLAQAIVGGSDESHLRVIAMALNYNLERPHVAVVCAPVQDKMVDRAFAMAVQVEARRHGAGDLILAMDDRVVLLATGTVDWVKFHAEVESATGRRCCLGIGDERSDALALSPSCAEASLAFRLRRFSQDDISFFNDLRSHGFLARLEITPDQEQFINRTIGDVLDYDDRRHGELVTTLEAYFATGGNAASAAALLHIHRNSLKYRLARAKALSGLDPENPSDRFNLQLACEMWAVRSALQD